MQQNPQPERWAVAARYGERSEPYLRLRRGNQYAYRDLELLGLADLGLDEAAQDLFDRAAAEAGSRASWMSAVPRELCSSALRERGWEPQGVEISAAQASYGRAAHGLPIFAGTLEAAAFPAGSLRPRARFPSHRAPE